MILTLNVFARCCIHAVVKGPGHSVRPSTPASAGCDPDASASAALPTPCVIIGVIGVRYLQGMKDTYGTYMDSIRKALQQRPDDGSGSNGSGGNGSGGASATAVAAEAEAAVNSGGSSLAASAATSPAADGTAAKAPPPALLGSPLARQLWERWFRDLLTAALLLASLWLMRRAVAGGAAAGAGSHPAAAAAAAAADAPGFWQGRRVLFPPGAWPQLQATPAAI